MYTQQRERESERASWWMRMWIRSFRSTGMSCEIVCISFVPLTLFIATHYRQHFIYLSLDFFFFLVGVAKLCVRIYGIVKMWNCDRGGREEKKVSVESVFFSRHDGDDHHHHHRATARISKLLLKTNAYTNLGCVLTTINTIHANI